MPRPGPRPYECIRRAWHSDSHQPLRGALIQEIFRVVNELHSISTRRKKEWQEKLPIVVLRAEEILYSKANSESEYAEVETLKNRLEDAVNTMIRRDDSEEEGLYLPPCVEAALSLGCTPKKVSRGQRQISSRLLPNGTRHNGTVCASSNKGMSGKGRNDAKSAHDCVIGALKPQMQDQCFSAALPMGGGLLNSASGFAQGTLACYAPSPGFVLPQNFPLPASFEASHPSITQSLPQLGGLVQFLKSVDPVAHGGGPKTASFPMQQNVNRDSRALQYVDTRIGFDAQMDAHSICRDSTASFPMQQNVNHDSRPLQYFDTRSGLDAQMDVHSICRDSNGTMCTTSTIIPPASALLSSTLGRNVGSEHHQLVKTKLVGAMGPCIDGKAIPQLQQIVPRVDLFPANGNMQQIAVGPVSSSTNPQMQEMIAARPAIALRNLQGSACEQNRWQTCHVVPEFKVIPSSPSCYRASSSQRGIDSAHANGYDLQLRLGPPGIEATSTSVMSGDPSAPKRSRVEHDVL